VEAIVEQGARTVASYIRHRMAAAPAGALRAGVAALMKQVSDEHLAAETRAVLRNSAGLRSAPIALTDALTELFTAPAAGLGPPTRAGRPGPSPPPPWPSCRTTCSARSCRAPGTWLT
jgi:hypothetical protein